MSKCVLSFDDIGILVQKSDDRHSDNDWMSVVWMINGKPVRSDVFPLLKSNGDSVLHHGDVIAPFSLEIPCADTDVVHAAFTIVNLGSYDRSDQKDVVTKQANKMADVLIDAYADILKAWSKATGPAEDIFQDGIEFFRNAMKQYMDFVFGHSILQLFDDILDELADLLGPPQCNGLVLSDYALFLPGQPFPDLTIAKTVTSPEKLDDCGNPAMTSLQITMHRELDVPMQFANTPPPPVDTVPATGLSLEGWVGTWCEDSTTPTPRIVVTLGDVRRSRIDNKQVVDITIREDVDLRYGARFTAVAIGASAEQAHVVPFTGNVFGSIKPLATHAVAPGDLKVVHVPLGPHMSAPGGDRNLEHANKPGRHPAATGAIFKLDYTRQNAGGTPIHSRPFGSAGAAAAGSGSFLETVEAIVLRDRGVTLALYEFRSSGSAIGHGVRYLRTDDATYSRADVMLVRWTPVG